MKFSNYIILEKPGAFMDPLGFMKPYAALQDMLFKQFTILSNHPAYHGLLSCIFQKLETKGISPKQKDFSREFRKLEILWGIHNVLAEESVLNITKYKELLDIGNETNKFALKLIPKNHPIYVRLGYGTLGHYASPSILWGLLEKGGMRLTDSGIQLGKAYEERNGKNLSGLFDSWMTGETISIGSEMMDAFRLSAKPGKKEQLIWQNVIAAYCQKNPRISCLWDEPFSQDELIAFVENESSYKSFFPQLIVKYPSLRKEIELIRLFETLAAGVQFIFDREYLTCHYDTDFNFPAGAAEEAIARSLHKLSQEYVSSSGQDARVLFRSLCTVSTYADTANAILEHHRTHQKAKGVSPFVDDGKLLVKDKVDKLNFTEFWENLSETNSIDNQLAMLNYRYRRDWHFGRATRYSDYARGRL